MARTVITTMGSDQEQVLGLDAQNPTETVKGSRAID